MTSKIEHRGTLRALVVLISALFEAILANSASAYLIGKKIVGLKNSQLPMITIENKGLKILVGRNFSQRPKT